jgi:DNA-binding SARP family transcriptional activator
VTAQLDLLLLGEFRAVVGGRAVPPDAWRQGRAASLVKVLALSSRHRLPRDRVIDALWPEASPDAGAANVRKAVHFARRALGGVEAIAVRQGAVELWPAGPMETDVERFEGASARARSRRDAEAFRQAVKLYPADLLPDDISEVWSEDRRRSLRDTYLDDLRGARMWIRLLEVEPTDEEAHRELMRAHLEAGNRQAAIRQFERLREVLRDELGVSPDQQSVEVYEQVLASEGREAPTAAERARALLAWGVIHWKRQDLEEAQRTALEARALAVDAGLGAQVGEASMLLASIGVARGEWRRFLRGELLETVRRTPDLAPFVFDSNLCFTEFCLYLPDGIAEMAQFATELREAAEWTGSTRALALATLILGETALLAGQLADAEPALRRAVELHRESGTRSGESISLERLAELSMARGQRWKARRLLERALRLAEGDPLGSHLLVKIHGALVEAAADPATAAAAAADGERVLARGDVCEQCSMSFRIAASTAFSRAGNVVRARRHLEDAARISEMWQGGPWPAVVREAQGKLELALGNQANGDVEFAPSTALLERARKPHHAARSRTSPAPH